MDANEKRICLKCFLSKENKDFGIRWSTKTFKKWCLSCCRKQANMTRRRHKEIREELKKVGVNDQAGKNYVSRNEWLRLLGFANYQEYLASDLWKNIRREVYKAKGHDCFLCGNQAQALHHNRYHKNDLTGKRMKFIFPICNLCHREIEFKEKVKIGLPQAVKLFKKKRKKMILAVQNVVPEMGDDECLL